jgi:hypothetical protein
LGSQLVALAGQSASSVIDVLSTSSELVSFDHTALVEVRDAPALCGGRLDAPLETGELGAEQLVVRRGPMSRDGLLTGEKDLR